MDNAEKEIVSNSIFDNAPLEEANSLGIKVNSGYVLGEILVESEFLTEDQLDLILRDEDFNNIIIEECEKIYKKLYMQFKADI